MEELNTSPYLNEASPYLTVGLYSMINLLYLPLGRALPLPYEGNGVTTGPLIYIVGGEDDSIMVEEEGEVAGKFEGSSDDPTTNTTGIGPLSFATWATRLWLAIAAVKAVVLGVTPSLTRERR